MPKGDKVENSHVCIFALYLYEYFGRNKSFLFDFKSSDIYDRWISSFKAYCSKFDNKAENPSSILEFLVDLAEIYASSTLWQIYSILNKYMKVSKKN